MGHVKLSMKFQVLDFKILTSTTMGVEKNVKLIILIILLWSILFGKLMLTVITDCKP